ncbi:MAG: ThiF family adenylyltransferase [Eggerthellaceae bacterium]|nr:ThiF family adenylyltransferase [Eggerthellaceae bacterium]
MADERLERLALLVGEEGLSRLARARIIVLGLGGVGGSCALTLARSGVGNLVLIDGDVVEKSNFNRQAIAFEGTLGMPKPEACARLIAEINPGCTVETICRQLTSDDIPALLEQPFDYLLDCIDDLPVKIALAYECATRGLPFVSSMGTARKWRPDLLRFADLSKTRGCPVAKIMRRSLRKQGVEHVQVLYSEEEPAPMLSDSPKPLGSNAIVPPIAGTMLAGFAVRQLLGRA